jgi:hypothetical protein
MDNIRKDKITIVRREGHYEAIEGQTFEEACSYLGPTFRSTLEEEIWIEDEESYDVQS